MKRIGFFLLIAVLLIGTTSAQDRNDRQDRNNRPRSERPRGERQGRNDRQFDAKSVTIEGTLQLENGSIAVASGDTVYRVPMLTRYIGFIDGLKEGAKVSVEGYEDRNVIFPSKVTIGSNSYDFNVLGRGQGGPGFLGGDGRARDDGYGCGFGMMRGRGGRFGGMMRGRGGRGGCGW